MSLRSVIFHLANFLRQFLFFQRTRKHGLREDEGLFKSLRGGTQSKQLNAADSVIIYVTNMV